MPRSILETADRPQTSQQTRSVQNIPFELRTRSAQKYSIGIRNSEIQKTRRDGCVEKKNSNRTRSGSQFLSRRRNLGKSRQKRAMSVFRRSGEQIGNSKRSPEDKKMRQIPETLCNQVPGIKSRDETEFDPLTSKRAKPSQIPDRRKEGRRSHDVGIRGKSREDHAR